MLEKTFLVFQKGWYTLDKQEKILEHVATLLSDLYTCKGLSSIPSTNIRDDMVSPEDKFEFSLQIDGVLAEIRSVIDDVSEEFLAKTFRDPKVIGTTKEDAAYIMLLVKAMKQFKETGKGVGQK